MAVLLFYVQASLQKQLKDLDEKKRTAIRDIAKDTEDWLKKNRNASDRDIKEYMKGIFMKLQNPV